MMKLSIIIPMYGVELYIEKCLRSCIDQKNVVLGEDYEIICINDGSPDRSAEIAKNIANDYKGIRIINQENQGLSGARNTGIENAAGEYVWFVDSDDWIEKNCIEGILNSLDSVDVLCLNYTLVYDEISNNREIKYKKNGEMSGRDLYILGRHTQAQFYICKKQFLNKNNLRFYVGIYHEDADFNYRLLYSAERIRVYDTPVYCFYKRPNSITTTFKIKRLYDLILIMDRMRMYMDLKVSDAKFKKAMYYYLCMNFNTFLSVGQRADHSDKLDLEKEIRKRKYIIKSLFKSPSIKHKLEGVTMLLSCNNYFYVYKLFS